MTLNINIQSEKGRSGSRENYLFGRRCVLFPGLAVVNRDREARCVPVAVVKMALSFIWITLLGLLAQAFLAS